MQSRTPKANDTNEQNEKTRKFRLAAVLISIFAFASVSFADTSTSSSKLTQTLCQIYKDLNSIIPIVAFVLFILSGVSYAGGQFFGAETRARAITWSMSMLTGAVIGLLITQFASLIITNLIGSASSISTLCPL
ncbi:TrbC/VIRB2 family protein [uncultured archaeon]|nr:TrbC/VIRB2 family protein [uncultured archaeon]